jgi:hypothetical protein
MMSCNHVLFCAPINHFTGGSPNPQTWREQGTGKIIQGKLVEVMSSLQAIGML